MNGQSITDPFELEDSLGHILLDDPEFPLAVERTRRSRPEIPPPPRRRDSLWSRLRACAEGDAGEETGIKGASHSADELSGTVAILAPDVVPTVVGGTYDNWRLIATVERRMIRSHSLTDEDDIAVRHRAIELRVPGDRKALDLTPMAPSNVAVWSSSIVPDHSTSLTRPQAIVGWDSAVRTTGDGRHGTGNPELPADTNGLAVRRAES